MGFVVAAMWLVCLALDIDEAVLDADGEPCRIRTIDKADPDMPYELVYPNGDVFWAAASAIDSSSAQQIPSGGATNM